MLQTRDDMLVILLKHFHAEVHNIIVKDIPTKCANNIYFLTLLHLHISVTADHHRGSRCYKIQPPNNMCSRPRYNYLQLYHPDPKHRVIR